MTTPLLPRLLARRPLTAAEARRVFDRLVAPETEELERAAILVALASRPSPPSELAAFAREMRRRARPFPVPRADKAVDLCGSGGARTPSFNVSTASAFVVAAAGVSVVKHGNRSATGVCGSSDLLEALGLPVTSAVGFARATYRAHRIAFLHAPLFHPAAKAVAAARRAVGIPTVFNRLGPLSNPAHVPFQLTGAPTPELARKAATVLGQLGVERALAMASEEGCDEFSPHRPTRTFQVQRRRVRAGRTRPETLLRPDERRGSWAPLAPADAAKEVERLFAGGSGARRGAVVLTAGEALSLTGEVASVAEGVQRARAAIDSGSAAGLLRELRQLAAPFREAGR